MFLSVSFTQTGKVREHSDSCQDRLKNDDMHKGMTKKYPNAFLSCRTRRALGAVWEYELG